MAPSRSCYCFSCACLCLFFSVSLINAAGNVDTLEPIVRISPVRGMLGGAAPAARSSADFFGYSVTLHQVKVSTSFEEALTNTRIIVGAPKGTFPGGLDIIPSSTPVNETGLVYNCPVTQGSCGMIGSGEGDDARLFDPDPNSFVANNLNRPQNEPLNNVSEHKTMQLMGAVTVSSGEYFVVCAPRYTVSFFGPTIRELDTRRAIGRCFVSSRNLTGFIEMRPCVPSSSTSGNNLCVAGSSAVINQANEQSFVAMGAPASRNFQGEGFLYRVNDTTANRVPEGYMVAPLLAASDQYDTYAMTVGNITGRATLDYIVSSPRADGSDYRGLVVIRSNFIDVFPTAAIRGTQLAEYFGWSVAAADLNGDGYDEVIVGAPLYSETNIQEYGRVYVFRNNRGDISAQEPIILSGDRAPRARFGTSVVNLGDVNDDGYEDIAVGAPYQEMNDNSGNSGKVFIYYGSSDNFVDTIADQTISAADVVSTTGQRELKSFGFSLSSGVDVDNNEYLDLLVGAYESGTTVLFRALSVARIQITANSSLTNNELFIDLTGGPVSFTLTICASFSGRGLTEGVETILNVNEDIRRSGTRHLVFDGYEQYSQPFSFSAPRTLTCKDIDVSLKDRKSLFSGDVTSVESLQIQFTLTQEPRVTPPGYDGNPDNMTDLRTTPILLISGNQSFTVDPMVICGNDVCEPDLAVSVVNQRYIYRFSGRSDRVFTEVIAGASGVDRIITPFRVENRNPDSAVGATLRIFIPEQFKFNSSDGIRITCSLVASSMTEYNCPLPTIIDGEENLTFNLTWSRIGGQDTDEFIIATKPDFDSSVSVNVVNDTDETNNDVLTVVGFGAISDLEITGIQLRGPSTYNSETPPSDLTSVDQLGEEVELIVTFQNNGPTVLHDRIPSRANVTILLPTRDSSTGSNYFLYPGSYTVNTGGSDANVTCDENNFNPDGLLSATRRRRRSIRARRQESAAQDGMIPADSLVKNCNASVDSCMDVINCYVMNLTTNQPITITITSYLDRRFFSTRMNPFTFVAVADIKIVSNRTVDDKPDNRKSSNFYSIVRMAQDRDNGIISIIIPIVAVIGALILIIALFCILFFCGFFRRKRYDKEEPEEIQVREVPPEGEAANGGKPAPPPGEEVQPDKETTPTKDPLENEIGDATDLHDGEIAQPEAADPDETSL